MLFPRTDAPTHRIPRDALTLARCGAHKKKNELITCCGAPRREHRPPKKSQEVKESALLAEKFSSAFGPRGAPGRPSFTWLAFRVCVCTHGTDCFLHARATGAKKLFISLTETCRLVGRCFFIVYSKNFFFSLINFDFFLSMGKNLHRV